MQLCIWVGAAIADDDQPIIQIAGVANGPVFVPMLRTIQLMTAPSSSRRRQCALSARHLQHVDDGRLVGGIAASPWLTDGRNGDSRSGGDGGGQYRLVLAAS
jgi:hypothetical protein